MTICDSYHNIASPMLSRGRGLTQPQVPLRFTRGCRCAVMMLISTAIAWNDRIYLAKVLNEVRSHALPGNIIRGKSILVFVQQFLVFDINYKFTVLEHRRPYIGTDVKVSAPFVQSDSHSS